jgi:hypothetical protein
VFTCVFLFEKIPVLEIELFFDGVAQFVEAPDLRQYAGAYLGVQSWGGA